MKEEMKQPRSICKFFDNNGKELDGKGFEMNDTFTVEWGDHPFLIETAFKAGGRAWDTKEQAWFTLPDDLLESKDETRLLKCLLEMTMKTIEEDNEPIINKVKKRKSRRVKRK